MTRLLNEKMQFWGYRRQDGRVGVRNQLLTDPPSQRQINAVLDSFSVMINDERYGVANIVATNIKNAIRIHSASGGSTNLMMHIVAAMLLWKCTK